MNLRFPVCIFSSVLSLCAATKQDWRIEKSEFAGPSQDILFIESTVTISWDGSRPLQLRAYGDVLEADLEIADEKGRKLPSVIMAGPAPSFEVKVEIRPGEKKSFLIATRAFSGGQPGPHVVRGRISGASVDGSSVDLELGGLRIEVAPPSKKKPNQASQPTSLTRRG